MTRNRASALALVAAGLLVACAGYVDQRAEAALREALPRLLGPAEHYDVSVRGAGGSRVDEVHAVGTRVRRPGSPVLARVEVRLADVAVDRVERRIVSIGRATVALHLSEQDLSDFIGRQEWIDAGTVRLSGADEIRVAGRIGVPGMPALSSPRAELRGRLVPRGAELLLRIDAVTLGDRAAPSLVRRLLEQSLNPIFDAADHAVPSQLDSVAVSAGELVIRASGSDLGLRRPLSR